MAKPENNKPVIKPSRLIWASVLALFLFTASAPFWATDEEGTRKALAERGLKPVAVGRYDSLGCLLDLYATRFAAEDKEGKVVKGVACSTPGISGIRIEFDKQ